MMDAMSIRLHPWYAVSLKLCSLWLPRQQAQCVSELYQTTSQRTHRASRHTGEYKYVEINQLQHQSISYNRKASKHQSRNRQLQF